jgi:hypothetical protein
MGNRLHIFSPVWGNHFTNLFENALGRSLKWPANAEAVNNAIWTIATDSAESGDKLRSIARSVIPNCEVRILINSRFTEPGAPIGALKMKELLKSIEQCLEEKTPMLMSTPDFIWSNGSIITMLDESYAYEGSGLCVSLAHMRVLPDVLELMDSVMGAWDSRDLVELGLTYPHDSWVRSEYLPGSETSGIYHSGVSWRDTGDNILSVQHQMPSPFLVNFKECDFDAFCNWKGVTPPAFGEWDHDWPSRLLDQGRLRYLGSSDLAFMIEVTEAGKNVPPLTISRRPHDEFFRSEPSVKIQKQFISTFRY